MRLLDESRRKRAAAEDAQKSAAGRAGSLEERLSQRRSLSADLKQAERQRHLWGRLVPLLGREGLQYYLLERAEQAIVEHANAILDRLAAGQVHVQLREQQRRKGGVRRAPGPRGLHCDFRTATARHRLSEWQPAIPLGRGPVAGDRPVCQPLAPTGTGSDYRRRLWLPGFHQSPSDDPGTPEPSQPAPTHRAGVPPGGVHQRFRGRLPM